MSDSTGRNEAITEIVPKKLGQYLLDEVSGLKEYYDEFPAPNMTLKMPSVSIHAVAPEFRPQAVPYRQKDPIVPNTTPGQDQTPQHTNWVVGFYDTKLQLDIWAGNKEERDDLYDAVFNALNPKISPMGLTLKMDEYFDQLCDYLYVSHVYSDSEERSQRDEWRATLTILATCNVIRTRKEFVIETTDLDIAVLDTSQEDPDLC